MADEATTASVETTTSPHKKTLPRECLQRLQRFDEALTSLETALAPILETGFDEHLKRTALELVQVDVMTMFVLNSLGWCLVSQRGKDPKDSIQLADELKRTKQYVDRVKSIELRKSAPGLNKRVAKAFVRNALWKVSNKRPRPDGEPGNVFMEQHEEERESSDSEDVDFDPRNEDVDDTPSYVVANVKFEEDQKPHHSKVKTGRKR